MNFDELDSLAKEALNNANYGSKEPKIKKAYFYGFKDGYKKCESMQPQWHRLYKGKGEVPVNGEEVLIYFDSAFGYGHGIACYDHEIESWKLFCSDKFVIIDNEDVFGWMPLPNFMEGGAE